MVDHFHVSAMPAIHHWWGAGTATITKWRQALEVPEFNAGTTRLWSHWKLKKLPRVRTVRIDPRRLHRRRVALGLTQRQVAARMGWSSRNSYGQYEARVRKQVGLEVLRRLAGVLECRPSALTLVRVRKRP